MADISSVLKLRPNRRHYTVAECEKEPFGENHFSISFLVKKIIQINENSKWLPGGHLFFFYHNKFHLGLSRDQDAYMSEV